MQIIKRDQTLEEFNFKKIENAITKAFASIGDTASDDLLESIKSKLNITDGISVEDIQDQVENALFSCGFIDVGKSFIRYRENHKNSRELLSRIDYMYNYMHSGANAATASETDANANVTIKNVANLEGEVYKTTNRRIQRLQMKLQLNKQFPEVAKQYEKDLDSHIIYGHDEATTPVLKNYCMAVSLYPLMLEGVGNIDGVTPGPPNDIKSFSGQLTNLVFLLSSQCRGAVAVGEYFIALNYYVIAEFGEDWYNHLDDIITSPTCKKQHTIKDAIYAGFKQFVWGINQPAGNRGHQSPSNKN